MALESLDKIITDYELVDGGTVTDLKFSLPERFWTLHRDRPSFEERAKAIKSKNKLNRVTWAVDDLQRSRYLVDDLRRFNEDLRTISGDLRNTTFAFLPSKVLPQVLGADNLQRLIDASAENDPDLSLCAALKKEVLLVTQNTKATVDRDLPFRKTQWMIAPKPGMLKGPRYTAAYKETNPSSLEFPVLLEEKSYIGVDGSDHQDFVEKRVEEICRILVAPKPVATRMLECIGYFPDRARKCYSFIYKFPSWANLDEQPASLSQIFTQGYRPALGARFRLAATLANASVLLQACGVLHKGLAAENVLFFKAADATDYDLTNPFIVGFEYARLHGKNFISEQLVKQDAAFADARLYSHPDYSFEAGQRYLKVFDLYSLGILLVQVGLWSELKDLADRLQAFSTKPPTREEFRGLLIRNIPHFQSEVGEIFTNAVARCVTGDLSNTGYPTEVLPIPQADDDVDSTDAFQSAMVKNVVQKLLSCRA